MSLSKCARLFRTSSLILRQQQHKSTWQNSLRALLNQSKNDMFIVEKNFDTKKHNANSNKPNEEGQQSKFKFYSAIVITSSVLIATFYLFKWQIKSLLAKEEESKGEVREIF